MGNALATTGVTSPLRANAAWREARRRRVALHAERVRAEDPAFGLEALPRTGARRAVWCVELERRFESLSAAARFVGRTPGNVLTAVLRGSRCGPYHWERCEDDS